MNDINTNDPRLTAYALGELEDADRVEFESLLTEREDLRAEIDAIRSVANELHEELMHEPTPALSGQQREAIKAGARSGSSLRLVGDGEPTIRPAAWWWRAGISGAAAVLLLGVAVPVMMRGRTRGGEIAIDKNPAGPTGGAMRESLVEANERPEGLVAKIEEASRMKDELADATKQVRQLSSEGQNLIPNEIVEYPNDWPELSLRRAQTETETATLYSIGGATSPPAANKPARETLARSRVAPGSKSAQDQTQAMQFPSQSGAPDGEAKSPARQPQENSLTLFRSTLIDDADSFEPASRDRYNPIVENEFLGVATAPLSTFSIDVDTASYSMVRRQLRDGYRPAPDSVRLEELINYFDYKYDAPSPGDHDPFRANVEVATCPWQPEHRLVRIGIKGMEIPHNDRPATNLVFLLDVSGSMSDQNKLPLVKQGLMRLVDNLTVDDRVAIVVYAGASGLVLDSTFVSDKDTILGALDRLSAGGSTNGGAGIELAYKVAQDHFIKDGVNRVILATDGDFNVGVTNNGDLFRLIEEKAKSGVFLTTLGFGTGNLNDAMLEQLADKGNGMCAYIDTIEEAQKVLVDQMSGSLVTIAKDVKIQVEFNPAVVKSYRLLGYENRALAARDFNDDTKDAGEIGAGHTVTALYEIEPVGLLAMADAAPIEAREQVRGRDGRAMDQAAEGADAESAQPAPSEAAAESKDKPASPQAEQPAVDPLRYQAPAQLNEIARTSGEMLTVKLRYKQPDGDTSTLVQFPVHDEGESWDQSTGDFKFAASVAAFGMVLRDSSYKGDATFNSIMEWARAGESIDPHGYRKAFVEMVAKAKQIIDPTSD